jgi:hypothetical protein
MVVHCLTKALQTGHDHRYLSDVGRKQDGTRASVTDDCVGLAHQVHDLIESEPSVCLFHSAGGRRRPVLHN